MQNKFKYIYLTFLLISINSSCKREKFDQSYSEIFGNWKWTHTETGSGDIFNPSSAGHNYSVELSNKCLVCKKNNKNELKRKFKSISSPQKENSSDTSTYGFFITTSRKEHIVISYIPNKEILIVSGFPYTYVDTKEFTSTSEYAYYTNYYVRE